VIIVLNCERNPENSPNGELRSSWLSLAEGCRGNKLFPCKANELEQAAGSEIVFHPSPFQNNSYRICKKAATGAMDDYPGKAGVESPFAGSVKTVLFRRNLSLTGGFRSVSQKERYFQPYKKGVLQRGGKLQ